MQKRPSPILCQGKNYIATSNKQPSFLAMLKPTPIATAVFTVQLIIRGLPTITPCIGPGGDMVTVRVGTVCSSNHYKYNSNILSSHTNYIQCDTIIGH